jgi:tetratricopeptide (TPR) repeat protein/predicted Ser/Thr protein kinase
VSAEEADARLADTIGCRTDVAAIMHDRLSSGATIGRYIVLSMLGEGAMGVVYAAYDPELDRKVAVKIVDQHSDGAESRAQLMREAQAMARLSHPNVIAVHDVGVYEDRIFFAMEFVEAVTLGEWRKAQRREVREILDVFVRAGEGLLAAHAAGLVHRDFKPDNVLVATDGRVRVTDFGIARAADRSRTDGRAPDRSLGTSTDQSDPALRATRPGAIAGTPAYMAPEQFVGAHVDARSDQWSFCVALWEALYRELPFQGKTMPKLALAVTRGELREPASTAGVPTRLRKILVRGLNADPEQRWPGMRELLDALAHDPARARRSLAGAAALLVIGGALAWTITSSNRTCEGAEDKLVGIWDDTQRDTVHHALLDAKVDYGEDTWARVEQRIDAYARAWINMHRDACEATHVRGEQSTELLDLRVACLGESLHHLDALLGVLAEADAKVAERAVRAVAELPPIDRCADTGTLLTRQLAAPPNEIASEVLQIRSELAEAKALQQAGRAKETLAASQALVERARATAYGPVLAEALHVLGLVHEKSGAFADAEAVLREAYFTAMRHRHDEIAADAASTLVFVVGTRLARAEHGAEWAAHAEAVVGRWAPGGIEESRLEKSVGSLLHRQGELAEARARLEHAVELAEASPTASVAEAELTRVSLGVVLSDASELEKARALFERALDNLEDELGAEHPDLAIALNGLGNAEYQQHRLDDARAHYERALALWERSYGEEFPAMCTLLNNLGNVADDQGDAERARGFYERAVAVGSRTLGAEHPDVGRALQNLGIMLERTGDDAGARERYAKALAIREKVYGAQHVALVNPLVGLARVELRLGDLASARAHAERAVAVRDKAASEGAAPPAGDVLGTLGRIELAAGETEKARNTLERAITQLAGTESLSAGRARYALALAIEASDPDRARRLLAEARASLVNAGHRASRDLAELDAYQD